MPTAKRVLVTRPQGQQEHLCELLSSAGYEPRYQPLLELQPLQQLSVGLKQMVMDLDLYQHVIFVSSNAVRFAMRWFDDYWPQLPTAVNWCAVGPASAALLADRGLSVTVPPQLMSSEGLLAMAELDHVGDERVLLVRGEGGRTKLRDTLLARGARIDELVCYRRCAPDMPAGQLAGVLSGCQAVLISSGDALGNMLALLSAEDRIKYRSIALVVPSQRVADVADAVGFTCIIEAANATDEAMLQALKGQRH